MKAFGYTAYTVEEATRRLERYCAYQERCHQECHQKLQQMRMIPEAIDQIMVHLIQNGFLNEERFASAFVRSKFRQKSWGRLRIRRALKLRDISEALIRRSLKEIEGAQYTEALYALARKRWEQLTGEQNPERKKQKLLQYLQYRGWETELIYDALRELSGDAP